MGGSLFGRLFRVTTFGESHGRGIGVVIGGCRLSIRLSPEEFVPKMSRRRRYEMNRMANAVLIETIQGSYFAYFSLYFWRGPPGDLVQGCIKRSRAESKSPWPFFIRLRRRPRACPWMNAQTIVALRRDVAQS